MEHVLGTGDGAAVSIHLKRVYVYHMNRVYINSTPISIRKCGARQN